MNLFNTVRYLYLQLATEVQYLHLNLWYLYKGGPKNRTVFRSGNFATIDGRKACNMSKASEFCLE